MREKKCAKNSLIFLLQFFFANNRNWYSLREECKKVIFSTAKTDDIRGQREIFLLLLHTGAILNF